MNAGKRENGKTGKRDKQLLDPPLQVPSSRFLVFSFSGSPLLPLARSQSVFENCVLGSTGHWPVPSGDSPDGMGSASAANKDSLLLGSALLVPVGGSPAGTGGSPVLPIFQIRSNACAGSSPAPRSPGGASARSLPSRDRRR